MGVDGGAGQQEGVYDPNEEEAKKWEEEEVVVDG